MQSLQNINPQFLKDLFKNLVLPEILKRGIHGLSQHFFKVLLAALALYYLLKENGLLQKKSVKNHHILITGAGSGIGRNMAFRFAKLGAKISLSDMNMEAVQKVEQDFKLQNLQGKAIHCDVSSLESVQRGIQIAIEHFGEVDILINNAGIVSGKKIFESSYKTMEKTMNVNSVAHFYTIKELLPTMIKRNRGHIVTISSQAGLLGVSGLIDYCASKFAVFGMNESLRHELQHMKANVQTTVICPFYINTGMFNGVSSPFPLNIFLPVLSENFATQRIVNAVLQNEAQAVLPSSGNLIFLLRALLPVELQDWLMHVCGANRTMEDFKNIRASY